MADFFDYPDEPAVATASEDSSAFDRYPETPGEPGLAAENPIDLQHPHLPWNERVEVMGASRYGPESTLRALAERGFDAVPLKDGRIAIRRTGGEKLEKWHVVDPKKTGDAREFLSDIFADPWSDLVSMGAMASGAITGSPAGPLGAVAGSAGGGYAGEKILAPMMEKIGVFPTPREVEGQARVSAAAGAIGEGVGQAIPPAAAQIRNLLGKLRGGGAAQPAASSSLGLQPSRPKPPTPAPEPVLAPPSTPTVDPFESRGPFRYMEEMTGDIANAPIEEMRALAAQAGMPRAARASKRELAEWMFFNQERGRAVPPTPGIARGSQAAAREDAARRALTVPEPVTMPTAAPGAAPRAAAPTGDVARVGAPLSPSPQAQAARQGAEALRGATPDLPPGKPEDVARILDEALGAGEEVTVSFVRRGSSKGMAQEAGEIRRMRIGRPPAQKTAEELAAEMEGQPKEALLRALLERQASQITGKGMAYKAGEKGLRTVYDLDAAAAGKGTAWRSLPMDSVVEVERAGKPIRFGPAGATEGTPERILAGNQLEAAAAKGETPAPSVKDPMESTSPGGVTPEDAGKRFDLPEPEGPPSPTGHGEPVRTWSGANQAVTGQVSHPADMSQEELLAKLTAKAEGRAPRSMDPFESRPQPEHKPYREGLTHRAGRYAERAGEATESFGRTLNPFARELEGGPDDQRYLLRRLLSARGLAQAGAHIGTGGTLIGVGAGAQVTGKLLARAGRMLMRDNGRFATVLARGAANVPPAVQSYAVRALKALEQGRPERFRSLMYAITTLPQFRAWLGESGAGLFGEAAGE